MKFKDISYVRPTVEEVNAARSEQLEKFKSATTLDACICIYAEIEDYTYDVIYTMWNLAYIRHSMDTTDAFYAVEMDYWNEAGPEMGLLEAEITKALMQSPFRAALEKAWGSLIFLNEEINLKTFNEEIAEDLKEENRLSSDYVTLMSSAQIEFNGKIHTLAELEPYYENPDREVRIAAHKADRTWKIEKAEEIERIFDQLIKVRAIIAKKLGHKNFVKTGYYRMQRNCYDKEMVTQFRDGILKHIVPIVTQLKEEQKSRIGVDRIKPYDDKVMFLDGNASPTGTPEEIFTNAKKMFHEMSDSTAEVWNFMQDYDFFDVMTRPGKAEGGYLSILSAYRAPFIFANFTGTALDIDGMLTHEFGHAWAYYLAKDIFPRKLQDASAETREVHAITMEFLAWNWMADFFGDEREKYYYTHLANHLSWLPYEAMVDEFQQYIYEEPEMTPKQRNQLWLGLQEKYCPWLDVTDVPFDEDGCHWQQILHIFTIPFYYINYALAGIVALSFWAESRQNFTATWKKYEKFTRLAGTKNFVELLEDADMPSPFVANNLKLVADEVKMFLANSSLTNLK